MIGGDLPSVRDARAGGMTAVYSVNISRSPLQADRMDLIFVQNTPRKFWFSFVEGTGAIFRS